MSGIEIFYLIGSVIWIVGILRNISIRNELEILMDEISKHYAMLVYKEKSEELVSKAHTKG